MSTPVEITAFACHILAIVALSFWMGYQWGRNVKESLGSTDPATQSKVQDQPQQRS
jgi:hypothetical protein